MKCVYASELYDGKKPKCKFNAGDNLLPVSNYFFSLIVAK